MGIGVVKLLANHRTEWVRRIPSLLLEGVKLIAGGVLVGVEPEIISLRNVVGVHRHTFEVVRTINRDTNLGIV